MTTPRVIKAAQRLRFNLDEVVIRASLVAARDAGRDLARALHPTVRNLLLKRFGARIQRANYRPLRDRP